MLKCGDSMIKPHMLSQIPSSCLKIQLSVLATVPRILINFFLVEILYHGSVLVIISGFTSIFEDFVIRRCQVTKFSARGRASPVRLLQKVFAVSGSQADVAISVLREVS